jgi:hypothetical protein
MTHGLPVASIPVDKHGDVDLTNHMQWMENRKTADALKNNETVESFMMI